MFTASNPEDTNKIKDILKEEIPIDTTNKNNTKEDFKAQVKEIIKEDKSKTNDGVKMADYNFLYWN